MKYILSIVTGISLVMTPTYVKAAGAGDAATLSTQIIQLGEFIPTTIASMGTQASTIENTIYNTIIKPLQNQLINAAIQRASNDIISWANGGFNGEPMIISNPEKYIRDSGLKQVRISLNLIPEGTSFGDSIFKSFARKYSFESSDMKTKLAQLSRDDMPSIVRKRNCNDEMLTMLATRQIEAGGGTFDNNEVVRLKNELNAYICEGDINDPEVIARLNDLEENNPSSSGWDGWLCETMGNCNDYVKSTKIALEIAQAKDTKERLEERELFDGLNAVSQKKCIKSAESSDGVDPECVEWAVATPGDVVTSMITTSVNAGPNRLSNLPGEGLGAFVEAFATQYITNGINEAISSAAGSNSNNSSQVISPRAIKPDLNGDPSMKKDIVDPMNAQFKAYRNTLTNIENIDQDFLSEIAKYEQKIQTGSQCYATSGGSSSPGALFFKDRQSRIDQVRESINAELSKITGARAFLIETMAKIEASQSTQEITDIYKAFTAAIISRGYPTTQSEGARSAEYQRVKAQISQDKEVTTYLNQCAQMNSSNNAY